jgi:hypothetical protein
MSASLRRIVFVLCTSCLLGRGQVPTPGAIPGSGHATVTVIFKDPANFTDVRENGRPWNSESYLEVLRADVEQAAAARLARGQRLTITFTDIDLAGETRFNQPEQIRIMTTLEVPRATLTFQLIDAEGRILKAGTRELQDLDYLRQAGRPDSRNPLYYDRQLLRHWLQAEFGPPH